MCFLFAFLPTIRSILCSTDYSQLVRYQLAWDHIDALGLMCVADGSVVLQLEPDNAAPALVAHATLGKNGEWRLTADELASNAAVTALSGLAMLAEVGIEMKLDIPDAAEFFGTVANPDADPPLDAWNFEWLWSSPMDLLIFFQAFPRTSWNGDLPDIAAAVKKAGAKILRGGAFKPRTSPYAFQGLGEAGLRMLRGAADRHDLKLVTEVMEVGQIEMIERYAHILQVGARNMQNFSLLEAVGDLRKPVLLKRGISATIKELLMAAEYIVSRGNTQVILCERGIRTFARETRGTLDLAVVPLARAASRLPIVVDVSHAAGRRDILAPLAAAALAVGADGVMLEVHPEPDAALSDAEQQISIEAFTALQREVAVTLGRAAALEIDFETARVGLDLGDLGLEIDLLVALLDALVQGLHQVWVGAGDDGRSGIGTPLVGVALRGEYDVFRAPSREKHAFGLTVIIHVTRPEPTRMACREWCKDGF